MMQNFPGNAVFSDERHPHAKFTNMTVRRVRRRYRAGGISTRAIARALGCSRDTVWKMVNGLTYRDVVIDYAIREKHLGE